MSEAATREADTEARDLLEAVVRIPSVSRNEAEAAERLVEFFESHDREAWLDEVGNVRAPADDSVLLTSHIDTVPGDIPVRVEETDEGDVLWGRGSVDAKGPLCAMAVAAVRTGASFVGVVGEEVDSTGARFLVEDRESAPGAVINGEPSGWEGITLGYRGLLAGTYVATSESGHSSRPENNAIQDAIDWWTAVEDEFAKDEWHPVFERVTCKPVEFKGGTSTDGLSVEATMDVQLRVPPEYSTSEIREIADGFLENGTVNWDDKVEPVMQSPRTSAARAFRAAIRQQGGEPTLLRKTGTSDMNVYAKAWDCPMVTYGPGDSDLDHAPNEHLPLDEYDRSVAVLETATERMLED
ncbi:acetyl-lysine deacetylase [Haloarcula taiwanensis]|uniref:Putative [LysW]-lysine/[LysW]-ornithine hydrolase n=1 Tax=Haloarcula taiwanensis TaxID=1932004 RepID=A0A2H5A1Z4_9EURY|nr:MULTISPECIES: [LysW]-lysine hydrolase [Haloarcula]AUG48766.1 acetyl-lysine deacetylase [Haloarcula taiwanensis]RLM40096.1 [LysW]-lysine hydrolase [Haloarcula sp. Atlit-120R]RLM48115.1 [LysW]-lysine hydrolase [Haloarcula sp. Atlit-47R]RLM96514.1 [LysW]-lysine hydrolase [Haloarcula sp. Atlit-7R]